MEYRCPLRVCRLFLIANLFFILLVVTFVLAYFPEPRFQSDWHKGYRQGLDDVNNSKFIMSMPDPLKLTMLKSTRAELDQFALNWNVDPVLGCRMQPQRKSFAMRYPMSERERDWYDGYEAAVARLLNSSSPIHGEILRLSCAQWNRLFETEGPVLAPQPGNDGEVEDRVLDQTLLKHYVIMKSKDKNELYDYPSLRILDRQGECIAVVWRRPCEEGFFQWWKWRD